MSKAKKIIEDCTRGCSNELCAVEDRYGKKVISYHEWLTPEQALAAIEIAKAELIEKAVEWLYNNYSLGSEGMKNFREAMNYDTKETNWQKQQDLIPSTELGNFIDKLSKQFPEVSFAKLSRIAVRVAKWQKVQDTNTPNQNP